MSCKPQHAHRDSTCIACTPSWQVIQYYPTKYVCQTQRTKNETSRSYQWNIMVSISCDCWMKLGICCFSKFCSVLFLSLTSYLFFSCCVILYCAVLALSSVSLLVLVFSVVGLELADLVVCQWVKPLVPSGPLGCRTTILGKTLKCTIM